MPADPVDVEPPDPPGPLALPSQIRAAAIVVLLQAVGLLVAFGVVLVKIAQGGYDEAGRAWADAGLALLAALALVFAARALSYLRPAVRTPLLVIEVLALPVGYSMIQSGAWRYGVPVILGAVVVTVLLLTRPARTALDRR